jgi:hypothetical protein
MTEVGKSLCCMQFLEQSSKRERQHLRILRSCPTRLSPFFLPCLKINPDHTGLKCTQLLSALDPSSLWKACPRGGGSLDASLSSSSLGSAFINWVTLHRLISVSFLICEMDTLNYFICFIYLTNTDSALIPYQVYHKLFFFKQMLTCLVLMITT